ncbi:MAG: o-succinylbenzoate synthase [candidate division Zixibacteria bacterium]|nr:o-succinylbenzoate synthase [candidate division Zixibacteria bacterium]
MKLFIKLYRYRLPLKEIVRLKGEKQHFRDGLLLKATDGHRHIGWGEIVPLVGFSRENFEEALVQAEKLKYRLDSSKVPDNLEELSGGFEKWLGQYEIASSVRCGLETAILNLIADGQGVPLVRLLSDQYVTSIKVNALLSGTPDDIIAQARLLPEQGYETVKLKLGGRSVEDDINLTAAVRKILGDNISLRLDANRAWEIDEALEFGHEVAPYQIEYIEEPLRDSSRLKKFHEATGMNIALDESLPETTPERLEKLPGVTALILKPTLLGGFEITRRFITRACALGMKSVISAAFESSIGLAALAHLAGTISFEDSAHGLDTLKFFEDDILTEPVEIKQGKIDLDRLPHPSESNMKNITEIDR